MPYTQHLKWFEQKYPGQGAQQYATAIQDRPPQDRTAADAFRQSHPQYFQQTGTPLRDAFQDVTYDPASRQVGIGGATFQAGQLPGTQFRDGSHYVTDQSALQAAIDRQRQTEQPAQEQPRQDITSEYTPEVQSLLEQIRGYIGTPPKTPDQMLQSEYGQQLMGAVDTMRDQQMRQARAQLAAAGALYPDDTRAAHRFADVGAEAARMQAAEVLPRLLSAAQQQRGMGLQEIMTGLGAHTQAEQAALARVLDTFRTTAPYYLQREEFRQQLPLQWTQAMGQVPGGAVPGGGGQVPARQYVEQKGGQISHRKDAQGNDIVTINGRDVLVQSIEGAYIQDGRTYLPQWVIDQALGG